MAKKQPTPKKTGAKSKLPRLKKPKIEEFMEIGRSPVPGITLRQVLRGGYSHNQPHYVVSRR